MCWSSTTPTCSNVRSIQHDPNTTPARSTGTPHLIGGAPRRAELRGRDRDSDHNGAEILSARQSPQTTESAHGYQTVQLSPYMSATFLHAAAWRAAHLTGRRTASIQQQQQTNAFAHAPLDDAAIDALLADAQRASNSATAVDEISEALHDLVTARSHGRHREILALLPSLRHPASAACLRGALQAALRDGFGFDGEAAGFVDDGEAAGWFVSALREIGDAAALGVLVDFAVCDRLEVAHACRQALGAWEEASVGERPLAVAREFRVRLRDGQLVARALPGSGPTGAAKPRDERRPPRSRDVAGGGYALFGPHRVEEEEDPFGDSPPGMF